MRTIEELTSCRDIVIAGGGLSGVAAALCAARLGASVTLLEQSGSLGGMATSGLVPTFSPSSDGIRNLYGGIFEEIVECLCRRTHVPRDASGWQSIDAECLKDILDEKLSEAKVNTFFQCKLCDAEVDGRTITAVHVATGSGLRRACGRVFIDATGDCLLGALAGAATVTGDSQGAVMGPTLCAQYADIRWDVYEKATEHGLWAGLIWQKMMEEGTAPLQEGHYVAMVKTGDSTGVSNLGHIYGANPLEAISLSNAYAEGRRQARIFEKFFKEHVPGFENVRLVGTAPQLGIRESRRLIGEYVLCMDDYVHTRNFEDSIGRCCYGIDIHAGNDDIEVQSSVAQKLRQSELKKGESYSIPYRALLSREHDNLLVAGRAISCDRAIQSSIRVMPACMVTGQAAGMAAALAVKSRQSIRSISIPVLQSELTKIGGII